MQVQPDQSLSADGIVNLYIGVNFVPNPAKGLWSCRCGVAVVAWAAVALS